MTIFVEPTLKVLKNESNNSLECSVHSLPKPLVREFRHVFGDRYLKRPGRDYSGSGEAFVLLAIPTNQQAREDLVAVGDHIETEKDRLLNVVCSFIKNR